MWICVTAYRGYRVRKDYRQSRQWTGWVRGVFIVFVSFVYYYSVFLHDCVFRYLFVLYSRSPTDRPSDVVLECVQSLNSPSLSHNSWVTIHLHTQCKILLGWKELGCRLLYCFGLFFFRNDTQSCTDFHSSRCKRMCTRHFFKHIFF